MIDLCIMKLPEQEAALITFYYFEEMSVKEIAKISDLSEDNIKDTLREVRMALLEADVALPVLLTSWSEYYEPVVEEWLASNEHLFEIEQRHFGWNHAQAGAWILENWKFPEELICFVGIHNRDPDSLAELDLGDTIALPLMTASLLPSSLHRDKDARAGLFVSEAMARFNLSGEEFVELLEEVEQGFLDIYELLGLCHVGEQPTLAAVTAVLPELTT